MQAYTNHPYERLSGSLNQITKYILRKSNGEVYPPLFLFIFIILKHLLSKIYI